MAINKLTSKFCETSPAGTHFDGQGLYLLVKPDGKRYWHMSFRLDKKRVLLSFGPYPKVSLEKARKARIAAWALIDQGINPAQHKKEKKLERIRESEKETKAEGVSFEQIARQLYESKEGRVTDESRNIMLRQFGFEDYVTGIAIRGGMTQLSEEEMKKKFGTAALLIYKGVTLEDHR